MMTGIPATCNPGGAGKWRSEFNSPYAGKDVVIFPDNDAPGSFPAGATEGPAGILDSMSRSPTERNAGDMPRSAAAVENWRELRVRMIGFRKGERRQPGPLFAGQDPNHSPTTMLIILPNLAIDVEQLCSLSPDAPSREKIRPAHCVICGQAARNAEGTLQLVGHGMYSRQVRGLAETEWIVAVIQRFLCLMCGHTMSLPPDWLHPWRWYAGQIIIEALCRHCILQESAVSIGARFGRPDDATEWKSLRRWRKQLLISPTLWGWLGGPRLGATKPAANRNEVKIYLERLLAEGCHSWAIGELYGTVRRTSLWMDFHHLSGCVRGRLKIPM